MGGGGEGGGGLGGGGEGGGMKGAALRTFFVYGGTSTCVISGKPSVSAALAALGIAAWSRPVAFRASLTSSKATSTEMAQADGLLMFVTPRRRAEPRRRRAAGKL